MPPKKWVGRSGFFFFFLNSNVYVWLSLCFKSAFYSHNLCLPLRTLLFFSSFDIKVQLFFFFLKQYFENVKKSLRSGGFREGRSGYSKHNFFSPPNWYLPKSPYTPTLLVDILTFKIFLQYLRWIRSNCFDFV